MRARGAEPLGWVSPDHTWGLSKLNFIAGRAAGGLPSTAWDQSKTKLARVCRASPPKRHSWGRGGAGRGRPHPQSERSPRLSPGPFNVPPPHHRARPGVTSPDGWPMEERLTGRRRRRGCPRGSERRPERWLGFGARGRRCCHQIVGSSRGRSWSRSRSRGLSGGSACELPRSPVPEHLRLWAGALRVG